MTAEERWLPVVGWEGCHEVSDGGRVRGMARSFVDTTGRTYRLPVRILSGSVDSNGYILIELRRDPRTKRKAVRVHTLVLEAFVGPRPPGMDGCHNDGNPANNRLGNLRWDTPSGNQQDKKAHGTCQNTNRTHCTLGGHALQEPNLIPSQMALGRRSCLACSRARCRLRYSDAEQLQELSDRIYARLLSGEDKPPALRSTGLCRSGRHEMAGDNIRSKTTKAGYVRRECRACAIETAKRSYRAKRQARAHLKLDRDVA